MPGLPSADRELVGAATAHLDPPLAVVGLDAFDDVVVADPTYRGEGKAFVCRRVRRAQSLSNVPPGSSSSRAAANASQRG